MCPVAVVPGPKTIRRFCRFINCDLTVATPSLTLGWDMATLALVLRADHTLSARLTSAAWILLMARAERRASQGLLTYPKFTTVTKD